MHEAKTQLSKLVQRVEEGEDVLIARNGKPVAKLVKINGLAGPRKLGLMRGHFSVPDVFNALDAQIERFFNEGDSPTDPPRSSS